MYVKLKSQFFLIHASESMLLSGHWFVVVQRPSSISGWSGTSVIDRAGIGLSLSRALHLFLAGQELL
jgi:hypothetical protein